MFLGGFGILPVVIYGLISVSKGWYLLPNSVLLKGDIPNFSSIWDVINFFGYSTHSAYQQILSAPYILILILIAPIVFIFQYSKPKGIWKDSGIMIIIFIATTLLHMQFARTGWFYRYEAYLVALGILVIAVGMREYLSEKFPIQFDKSLIVKYITIVLLGLHVTLPLIKRGFISLIRTPQATTNIYEQQYQMGLFLKQFYAGESVATNDIGVINYLADINCLDLFGLGSLEPAKAKRNRVYNTQQIYKLTRKVKIAILYDQWFEGYGGIPSQWTKVGEWKIFNNVVCGGDTVSFYAVNQKDESRLTENMRFFSPRLPKDVKQTGKYISKKGQSDVKIYSGAEDLCRSRQGRYR